MTTGSEAGEVADPGALGAGPPASVEVDGETWAASIEGAGRSGTGSDVAARLLLVRFSPGAGDQPARETLVAASSLGELGEDALREAFDRARPRRPPPQKASAPDSVTDDVSVSE